ncbi:helix-turn-helix domain-containing protein [Cesiribacter sp. SM1]|uniref:helix-turn-helix domain-containing protein n=1 Tax=Cesiribacter sp. SM1 TaxID=2861196 RepID=UPI001CD27AA3|nr:helix-turn-helix domain-containing protein [Cesiribacter sp. SM1]
MKNLNDKNETVVLMSLADFEEVKEVLKFLKSKADENDSLPKLKNWITEKQAMLLLGKKETWFWKMRNSNQLAFSKMGGTVFYEMADIEELIARNKRFAA